MALALEEMGFARYGSDKSTKSLFATPPVEPIDSITLLPKSQVTGDFRQAKYVMITGDKTFSPNNDEDIKMLNADDNIDGSKIKVVLISKAAGEGIDFKNIRQIHIMEPWYNMNRIEQIIGRGVRNLSHCKLPFKKRNVEIFLHATSLSDTTEEAVDMYVYRIAEKKSIEIGKITRILKETAVDCILNIGQTNFTTENIGKQAVKLILSRDKKEIDYIIGDKPFTEMCDYMENCDFTCSPSSEINVTSITYNDKFIENNNETIIKRIRDLFKDIPKGRHFYKRDDLFNSINVVKQYPDAQIFSALTYLIDNKNEHITDRYGRIGNLVNHGDYYLFQPIEITDDAASIYERTTPVDVKIDTVSIKLPELEKEVILDNFETPLNKIQQNYNIAFGPKITKTDYKNWYSVVNSMKDYILKTHLTNDGESKLKKYVVYHNMDSLGLTDLLSIINYKIPENQYKEIAPFIRKYVSDKTVIANNGNIGIILYSEKDEQLKFYTQNNSGIWEPAKDLDIHKFMNSPNYTSKYIINKKRLNQLFGFMSWIPIMEESVFKIRDLKSTVNRTGARVDQAQIKDIITKINTILGDDKFYTEDNIKDIKNEKTYIGEGKNRLVVMVEMLLRYKNDIDEKKYEKGKAELSENDYKTKIEELNNQFKIWFVTSEQMIVNSIEDIGKIKK